MAESVDCFDAVFKRAIALAAMHLHAVRWWCQVCVCADMAGPGVEPTSRHGALSYPRSTGQVCK